MYLHVITHNRGAIRFYKGHKFSQIRRLRNFYVIPDDKGPEAAGWVRNKSHGPVQFVGCPAPDHFCVVYKYH